MPRVGLREGEGEEHEHGHPTSSERSCRVSFLLGRQNAELCTSLGPWMH